MMKQFLPFHEVSGNNRVLIVDSFHPKGFALSHWRGAMPVGELSDDTSAGIVLNAIKKDIPELDYPFVTNNHFDIDGFVGVWAACNPERALQYEAVLREMALIGDFRELDLSREGALHALKLVCWINAEEKTKFYAPFGYEEMEGREAELCVAKYHYFLDTFEEILLNTELYKLSWRVEYEKVLHDVELIEKYGHVERLGGIRLQIVESPEPLHYYALFSGSESCDMVLSVYPENRYELEYKYVSWIDTESRMSYPRIDLRPLAERLNTLEESSKLWYAEKITDTAPMLRLDNDKLSKMQRYDDPYKREILSSSIPFEDFKKEVIAYFQQAYAYTQPQQRWTWKEMRQVNEKLQALLS